jgi:ribosome-associated translation inhibitor RaiA
MRFEGEAHHLRVELDTHHCELSQGEVEKLLASLDGLGRQVEHFPVADLRVTVEYNGRSNDYSVKTALILPGATPVANDHDAVMHAALDRCLDVLEARVQEYKDKLGQVPERQKQQKGTHHELQPDVDPDPAAVQAAVDAADYAAFRAALTGFEEPLRKRVGRWVERYPDLAARLGKGLDLSDIVEAVFLDAFEGYGHRPKDVRFGDWLESLIDPAVKELRRHPDEELENINLARSAVDAEKGPGLV